MHYMVSTVKEKKKKLLLFICVIILDYEFSYKCSFSHIQ